MTVDSHALLATLTQLENAGFALDAPQLSLNLGLPGILFYCAESIRLAERQSDRRALGAAAHSVLVASRQRLRLGTAWVFDGADAPPFTREALATGVFTGLAGLGYVEVLLGVALSESALAEKGVARIERSYAMHEALAAPPSELFMGTAGYVALCTDLESRKFTHARLRLLRDRAAERLAARHRRKSRAELLGAAHGISGELLALLLVPDAASRRTLSARLDELLAIATVDGGYIAWPSARGSAVPDPMWATFCNGVAGQTLLFARAFKVLGEGRYREAAQRCAATTFALASRNPTLCCGGAGAVAALAYAGRVLGDPAYARRAKVRLVGLLPGATGNSLKLMQGALGPRWLRILLANREKLHMPCLRALG